MLHPSENPGGITLETKIAIALRELDVAVTSIHPTVCAWVNDGFTLEQVLDVALLARKRKPKPAKIPANYLDAILRDDTQRPAQVNGKHQPIQTSEQIEDAAIERYLADGLTDEQIATELELVPIDRIRAKRGSAHAQR